MSAAAGFSYDYVFNLVSRLTPEEQERLIRELPGVPSLKSKEKHESLLSEPDGTPYSPEKFYQFLLSGPVIDEEHVQMMLDAREEINRCQPISW